MRRRFAGLAMLAIFAATYTNLQADDREVAQQIIQQLKSHRDAGRLKGFKVDMKVDDGVVLFRGQVVDPAQRDLVLRAAENIEGVTKIVNEISVQASPQPELVASKPTAVAVPRAEAGLPAIAQAAPQATTAQASEAEDFSLREALKSVTPVGFNEKTKQRAVANRPAPQPVGPSDQEVRELIVARLSQAKSSGQLTGFGLNVTVDGGVAKLKGRVQEETTRSKLLEMVSMTPGVKQVVEDIAVQQAAQPVTPVAHVSAAAGAAGSLPIPEPEGLSSIPHPQSAPLAPAPIVAMRQQPVGQNRLQPVAVQNARGQVVPTSATPVNGPVMAPNAMPGRPVSTGAVYGGQMGAPVPMYPVPQAGCYGNGPHMDGPNLPNYAWPGYAAHPNYAALTYPQQYSPSAWPYIGPFYPYPQVPLGWRKVSLEWDDGWWMLDFTDR